MILIIITAVCLAIVFGLVIWNIVYTVTQLKKMRSQLELRYAMDAAQNRKLMAQGASIQELSTKITSIDTTVTDIAQKRLPALEDAVKENEASISDIQAATEEELMGVGSTLLELSDSVYALQDNYGQFSTDIQELSDGLTSTTRRVDTATEALSKVSEMVDTTNNKLIARQLCLDSTCILAAQLSNLSPTQMQSDTTTTAPTTTTTPTSTTTAQ